VSEQYRRKLPGIPEPYENLGALYRTAVTTKETVETLAGQRGAVADAAVTWSDLVKLGLIPPERIPRQFG